MAAKRKINWNKLHEVQTYSADFANRSVDATIYSNGGTYHVVKIETIWDNGHGECETVRCNSRSKAITIAMYNTTNRNY